MSLINSTPLDCQILILILGPLFWTMIVEFNFVLSVVNQSIPPMITNLKNLWI